MFLKLRRWPVVRLRSPCGPMRGKKNARMVSEVEPYGRMPGRWIPNWGVRALPLHLPLAQSFIHDADGLADVAILDDERRRETEDIVAGDADK